jgi:hypothetical protein
MDVYYLVKHILVERQALKKGFPLLGAKALQHDMEKMAHLLHHEKKIPRNLKVPRPYSTTWRRWRTYCISTTWRIKWEMRRSLR